MLLRHPGLALALNDATSAHEVAAIDPVSLALNADGKAPAWVQLVPPGPQLRGRDGRQWRMQDAAVVVNATIALTGLPLVIDYDHATEKPELAANSGAAGWIEELKVENGSIWGRVDWTPRGAEKVAGREYRFVSPVLAHSRNAEQDIVALVSVGLVHRPNFTTLRALNRRQETQREDTRMLKDLLAALGLSETTGEVDAIAAVKVLKAQNSAADLTKYVPRAQYDETVVALNEARTKLGAIEAEGVKARAETLVDEAVKAGKIAPSVKADYVQLALNSFDLVKATIDKMPVVLKPGESEAARQADASAGTGAGKLTDAQKALCARMGLSEDAYAKSLAA